MDKLIFDEKNSNFRTFDIKQAASFLGAHKETVRRMAVSGELPAVKVGRAWRFIEQDLVMYMRNNYTFSVASQGAVCRSNSKWRYTGETKRGGSVFQSTDKEYKEVLGLVAS